MDFEKAAAYWEEKDAQAKQMARPELLVRAEQFLTSHNTCALATALGNFVRCTPLEYTWREGAVWILTEGGLKFRALAGNRNVCLAIFDPYGGFGALNGMQVTGTAEVVELWSEEYLAELRFRKIPEEALRRLEHPMYLLRVVPERMDFLSSEFKKAGFDARQHLNFSPSGGEEREK